MDLDQEITLTGKSNTSIQIPLINILRLATVHISNFYQEYEKINSQGSVKEFLIWVFHEKLKVPKGGKVLL